MHSVAGVYRRTLSAYVVAPLLAAVLAVSSFGPATNATAAPLKGARSCPDIDLVIQPRSAFQNTARGRVDFRMQTSRIEAAVLCLVNAERTGLSQLVRYRSLGRFGVPLARAASKHVTAAVALKWWGRVAPGKVCYTIPGAPLLCDPHTNPRTGS